MRCRGGKPKDPEERGMYQASVGLNMVTAAATAGFVAYYFGRQVFRKDSHVSKREGELGVDTETHSTPLSM